MRTKFELTVEDDHVDDLRTVTEQQREEINAAEHHSWWAQMRWDAKVWVQSPITESLILFLVILDVSVGALEIFEVYGDICHVIGTPSYEIMVLNQLFGSV